MHRVTASLTMVDDVDADGLVGAEVVDVPLRLGVKITILGLDEDRVVVVSTVRAVIDIPEEVGAVRLKLKVDNLGGFWLNNRLLAKGLGRVEGVVQATSKLFRGDIRSGGGNRLLIGILVVDGG